MKPSLLDHLVCSACRGGLDVSVDHREGSEIIEGRLTCQGCGAVFPVARGIPRFVSEGLGETDRTASAFGWEWRRFSGIDDLYERQFLDWMAPATPESFRERIVVEGGCGKGRHTRLVAGYGAKAVIAVDVSAAVEVARDNTREFPNVHVIQADLLRLPIRTGACDHAFSVGVLHHLPQPEEGFRSLARVVRPGGTLSIWVYGAENNRWIARLVSPVRRVITSRLPHGMLYHLSGALSVPLWVVLRAVYAPARRPGMAWLRRILFYQPYLSYISVFPFREIHHIVHDHLTAPVAHYLRREEVEGWYRSAGARDAAIAWHNRNSWRGCGTMTGGDAP